MGYPTFPGKHALAPFISPSEYREYLRSNFGWEGLPELAGTILTFQPSFFREVVRTRRWERLKVPTSALGEYYTLDTPGGAVGLSGGFGVGAPAATNRLEDIGASGCARFVAIGFAGGLQPGMHAGDLVLCDRAIRDEGVSHHYAPWAKYATPSRLLTARLHEVMVAAGLDHRTGPTWTIDTPYRETVDELRRYQQEGVLTVEMEAAALATVCKVRDFEFATAFTISDSLADPEWRPQFHHDAAAIGLAHLLEAAIAALTTTEPD
jgi:uridine phosphorylase